MSEVNDKEIKIVGKGKATKEMVAAALTKPANNQQLIYCGPSFKNLQQFSVFKGELPEHVKKIIKDIPIAQSLFVKLKDFPSFQANLTTKGAVEYQLFEKVLIATKGGKLNVNV